MEEKGKDNLVVVLGTPTKESCEVFCETMVNGDPTWAGPLAGIALGLPVFHITEPAIKEQVKPEVYRQEVGMAELALDVPSIVETVRKYRGGETVS